MDGGTSFQTNQNPIAGWSFPRKAVGGAVLVAMGFAFADPSFLSDASLSGSDSKPDDALTVMLEKLRREEGQAFSPVIDDTSALVVSDADLTSRHSSGLMLPPPSGGTSEFSVQSVSYPEQSTSLTAPSNSIELPTSNRSRKTPVRLTGNILELQ